ncbi:MAG: DUF6431 domain-containing protein [Clostridia bacterium]|nr:DUF6431 domain-containing protein [Clostridia bacterium]
MRVLNFCDDVNTYKEIIFKLRIEIRCSTCGTLMVYHACYEVNYKSDEIITKITILRYKCQKCNVTHALKPEFLASRHQYDTFQRQNYVLQYNDISKDLISLRQLCCKLFPSLLVSHTVMYYWVRVITEKKAVIEPLIIKEIQEYLPSCDISSELLPEAETIPPETRSKEYSKDMTKIISWSRIYIRITAAFRDNKISGLEISPFIYINRIMDILTAHEFL